MFLTESVRIIHKHHNKNLPSTIQNMIKESLVHPNLMTRALSNCTLQPKRETIGTTILTLFHQGGGGFFLTHFTMNLLAVSTYCGRGSRKFMKEINFDGQK